MAGPHNLAEIQQLLDSGKVRRAGSGARAASTVAAGGLVGLPRMAGRLVELTGSAALWSSFGLVLAAQRAGEPAAWVCGDPRRAFYPPDAAEGGVDLDALVVVRASPTVQALRAADILMRSGAFGLVVLDLAHDASGRAVTMPLSAQTRLSGLARRHDCALLCLTGGQGEGTSSGNNPGLGPMVSLRLAARAERGADGAWACSVEVLKDKQRGPGDRHREVCRGPLGLP